MRQPILVAVVLLAASALFLHAEDAPAPEAKPQAGLETLEQKVGYALGHKLGQDLKQQGGTIDPEAVARGIRDGLAGTAPVLSEQACQNAIMEYQTQLQKKAMAMHAEKGKKNKDEGIAFLDKNKTAEGVKVLPSGLQYKCVTQGNGQKPSAADTVQVNYEGTLLDGTVFDSSYKRGAPATFGLQQVIRAWTEGLQQMDVGSTYILYCPAELAYGENPPPGVIGPNAVLIFKVELLKIEKSK